MTPLAQATQITKDRLFQWRKRNEKEGVACTPVVLINSIHGPNPGIILNVVTEAPLSDILKILQLACVQVEKKIADDAWGKLTETNGGLASEAIKP